MFMGSDERIDAKPECISPQMAQSGGTDSLLNPHTTPWVQKMEGSLLGKLSASLEVFSRLRLTHSRPAYGINSVIADGREMTVTEETILSMPFGTLLRFKKDVPADLPYQPPVLLVAPLSGHFATLLRETVRTLLQDHDVYITDWHNARDVSLAHGVFGLDDYIAHMIRFIETIGPSTHVVAVCQPCVAALAATAIMAEDDNPAAIRRTALMTVEGERDDICSVGQTVAAQDLCPNIRPYMKTHHVQTGVGHYGVFSGRKWSQQIYPRVREMIHASMG
jgi:poly-beta-hydroxyalkanoate depolymerase